nr:MAG TPA: hypothetical protein [Caudoviricetes sp.]
MEFQERFLEALRISGKTRTELSKEVGISPVTISNWATGKIQGMRGTTAARFEEATGVRASWVLTGKGQKLVAGTEYEGVSPAAGMRTLPILPDDALMQWGDTRDPYASGIEPTDWIMSKQSISRRAFAFQVRDASMRPACLPGDLVVIDPDEPITPGIMVAATVGSASAVVRKYRVRSIGEDGSEAFELVPLNEDYPIIRSINTPVVILGAVAELRRSLLPTGPR